MMLVINGSAFPHTTRPTNLKDLILGIRSHWKRLFFAWLGVSVLTAVSVVMLLSICNSPTLCGHLMVVIGVVATVAAMLLLYLYLAPKWVLGLFISVVEDNWQGIKALGVRAEELILGKKMEGFTLVLVLALLSVPIHVLFYVTLTDQGHLALMVEVGFGFYITILLCLVNSFSYAFTVFYYFCSQRPGEKLEVKLGHGYDSAPSN